MAQLHPGVVVLLLSGLAIFWLTPASAWWMLSGRKDAHARIWFSGTALYALVATIFVFGGSLPGWLRVPATGCLAVASLVCMLEALRREVSGAPPPVLRYGMIFTVTTALFFAIHLLELPIEVQIVARLVILSLLEVILIVMANRVRRRFRSRALWLIIGMLAAFVASNLSRVIEVQITGRFSPLLEFSLLSSVALFVNYLSVICYSYGYWGFVIEKNEVRLAEARDDASAAREAERFALAAKLVQSSALSASIAHEVNQPLAAMQLSLQECMRIAAEHHAPESLHRLLVRAQQDNGRASVIVNRVRAMFRQEQPKFRRESLDDFVRACIEHLRPRLTQEHVQLVLSLDARVPCQLDTGELEHVFINLADNAVRALTHVPVNARTLEIQTWRADGSVFLAIADSGPGIPANRREALFDLSGMREAEGMGLGLWLASYVVERLGGHIRLDDTVARGARFVVELPDQQEAVNPTIVGLAALDEARKLAT